MTRALTYIDSTRMVNALTAAISRLFQRREYIDRINVFPVPDGDTGTNMAFSFKVIHEAIRGSGDITIKQLMARIATASLDGSRGNSGAIMAQYFQGFSEALEDGPSMTARALATASSAGARTAWTAMSEPVAGTLPTVLEDFSTALELKSGEGVEDIYEMLEYGLVSARKSLARTPELLPVLKQAGVVDAGGQGFVDLLEGIWDFIENGETGTAYNFDNEVLPIEGTAMEMDPGAHRFCTECVIEGDDLNRAEIMTQLEKLDCSSLVVAGGQKRVRVHIHVNNPGEAYLACEQFGELHQQKADDMKRQHKLMNQAGQVAIVTDSGADIPFEEQERLAIHMVSARLNFGAKEYIDYVSLMPAELYKMLEEFEESPKTSQPPVGDFVRVYDLLTGHGYQVMSVGLSSALSGTTQAAMSAAERFDGRVRVFDTLSGSCGEGLLVVIAAEAAQQGLSIDEIETLLTESQPLSRVFAMAADLSYLARGGRLPGWVRKVADFLHISPMMTAKKGRFSLAGITTGTGAKPPALGKVALRNMDRDKTYRIFIAHGANIEGAHELRRYILSRHTRVHSCHITEAGPALGVHLGPGGLVLGFVPQPEQLN
uniref:DegV family protein n=1 Tax=uncultured bacterium ws085G8 TaxID=1131825 RepID=I1X5D1_9BACT|nr:degV family protein [uncultured bacterium ws085G8]